MTSRAIDQSQRTAAKVEGFRHENHATDPPIERLALRLHETLCLAMSIVIGAVHGRAEANELFSNAVLRRIGTIATKSVSSNAPSFGANLLTVENGNAIPVVTVRGHVSPSSNENNISYGYRRRASSALTVF